MQIAAEEIIGARPLATSFVGRREELGRLRALVGTTRLLTIAGPGGSGKTRLAEELVGQLARSLGGRVAFAYLAGTAEPGEIGAIVAASVGLRGDAEPTTALVDYLRDRRFLLVLDNCEHVYAEAARLASRILKSCPEVSIVATSRRPLAVPGEQLFPIEGLTEEAAVSLFTDRVRLASPSFILAETQRPGVAELCARLDGMPLAIELAAARLRYLGLAELERRMAGRLTELGTADSAAPVRHQTLRGAIGWSHDLLDEPQRVVWRRLCIFVDGFTLAAAEAVAGQPPLAAKDVERLLGELVDRSMVSFDLGRDRYRVIEAMREYGLERLREAGEDGAATERLREWILGRTEDLGRRWWGPDQAQALDEMAAEAGNLRAALESCRACMPCDDGLRIATGSLWYWMTRASHGEAARWFVPFLGQTSDPVLGARAYVAAAWIAVLSGRTEESTAFLASAVEFATTAADPGIDAYVRVVTGLGLIVTGETAAAVELAEATLADPAADPICRSWAFVMTGIVAFLSGNLEESSRISREAIDLCRAAGESWTQVVHLHLLAGSTWQLGDPRSAAALLLEALRIDRRLDDLWHRAWTIEALGWVSVDLGRDDRAARLLGVADGCWAAVGSTLTSPWQPFHAAAMAELRRRMGSSRFTREFEAGKALDQVRALSFALEDATAEATPQPGAGRVSPRELEVAALVAQGCGNREIAERLFLSPRTVETHVQHLMDKIGVGSRAEIAAWHSRTVAASET